MFNLCSALYFLLAVISFVFLLLYCVLGKPSLALIFLAVFVVYARLFNYYFKSADYPDLIESTYSAYKILVARFRWGQQRVRMNKATDEFDRALDYDDRILATLDAEETLKYRAEILEARKRLHDS